MYGGHRLGDNLYGSSIVALNAKTGERVWHFQTVHHDLFDYDLPAAPILDRHHRRRPRRSKRSRKSRSTVSCSCSIARRASPCGRSRNAPCRSRRYRAKSRRPRSRIRRSRRRIEQQGLTENDLIDFTPALRAEALEIVKRYVIGPPFTPPSVIGTGNAKLGTIQLPGASGGANWNGGAFDPETGMFYVGSRTVAFVADLFAPDPARSDLRYRAGMREIMNGPRGLPLMKPPYGRITAFDLNRGEQAWMVPNGDGPRNHPALAGAEPAAARRRDAVGRHRDEDAAVRHAKPTRARRARRQTSAARSSRRSTRRPARRCGRSISASARTARR